MNLLRGNRAIIIAKASRGERCGGLASGDKRLDQFFRHFVSGYKKEKTDGRRYVERVERKVVANVNTVVLAIRVNGQNGVSDSEPIRAASFREKAFSDTSYIERTAGKPLTTEQEVIVPSTRELKKTKRKAATRQLAVIYPNYIFRGSVSTPKPQETDYE